MQRLFKTQYGKFVSQSHITQVIQKYNLHHDPVKAKNIKLKKRKGLGAKKITYAKAYSLKSSLSSFDFLMRQSALVDGKIVAILSDNGSEFAKYFKVTYRRLNIIYI